MITSVETSLDIPAAFGRHHVLSNFAESHLTDRRAKVQCAQCLCLILEVGTHVYQDAALSEVTM